MPTVITFKDDTPDIATSLSKAGLEERLEEARKWNQRHIYVPLASPEEGPNEDVPDQGNSASLGRIATDEALVHVDQVDKIKHTKKED